MSEILAVIARDRSRRRTTITYEVQINRNNAAVNYLDLTLAPGGGTSGKFDPSALLGFAVKSAGAYQSVVVGGHLFTVVWGINPAATSFANLIAFLLYDNTGTPVAPGVAIAGLFTLELTGTNGKL